MQVVSTKDVAVKVNRGMETLSDVVRVTMGGAGKNVLINNGQEVQIINDGVTIAKAVESIETGVLLAQNVAEKTNREAGDGTTTAIVLLQAFMDEMTDVRSEEDPRKLRQELREELAEVLKLLDERARDITPEDIEDVAYISSLDKKMAKVISEMIKEIGTDGIVTVEESPDNITELKYDTVKGIELNEGFTSPLFITDQITQKAVMKNVATLVSRKRITTVSDIMPLLEEMAEGSINELAIFCEEITDEVLTFLAANKVQGKFNSLVVKTRDLENVAIAAGANVITNEGGESYNVANAGLLQKVESDKYSTKIIMSNEVDITEDIKNLRARLKKEKSDNNKMELQRSIAMLESKVAVIKVAGNNDEEVRENKLKMEDALNSVKAALAEGVVEGGGMALWLIAQKIIEKNTVASTIMANICESPLQQIIENAEANYDDIETKLHLNYGKVYNVIGGILVEPFETGLIDPVKVTKSALTNAITMGTSILTSRGMIVNK